MLRKLMAVPATFLVCAGIVSAEPVARITRIDGVATLMRKDATDWRPANPNTPLSPGDALYTEAETFVEVTYATGAVLRMDEKTKITITEASDKAIKTNTGVGKVWVNMKKITKKGSQFEVSTPTATAAIRGTIYNMSTSNDSATSVEVYDGKVAVGPTSDLKNKIKANRSATGAPRVEVSGPEEIPGPYEVSLETWRTIVKGQRLSVRADGKFAKDTFDLKAASTAWLQKNKSADSTLSATK